MTVDELKEKARHHERREEWEKALELYRQALEKSGQEEQPDVSLYNRVGDLYIRAGDREKALQSYDAAVDLYLEAELPNNAIAICRKLIRNFPQNPQPFLRMGRIRGEQGFLTDARQNFLTYAEMIQAAGDLEEAFRALVEFVELAPDDVEMRLTLAEQLKSHERTQEAVEQLQAAYRRQRAIGDGPGAEATEGLIQELDPMATLPEPEAEEEPAAPGADGGAGELPGLEQTALEHTALEGFEGVEEGAQEEAEKETEEVAELGGLEGFGDLALEPETVEDEEEHEGVGEPLPTMELEEPEPAADEVLQAELAQGEAPEPEDPLSTLRARVRSDPLDGDTWRELAELLLEAGELEEGLGALESAQEGYAGRGRVADALEVTRRLAAHEPDEISHRQRLVDFADQLEDDAILVSSFLGMARLLERKGEKARARSVYQQILAVDSENGEARAALHREAPSPSAPSPSGEAAAAPAADSPEGKDGSALEEAPAPAEDEYVDLGALVLDGEEKTTRWVVSADAPSGDEDADFAKMLGQFKEKVAQNLAGEDGAAHYDLGTAYMEMGLVDEAISEFQQALRLDSRNLAAFEMLGRCFLTKEKPGMAVRVFRRALETPHEVEDDLLGIYYYLANALEAEGNSEEAREFYEKVFSLDINFKDVTERLRGLR